MISAENTFIRMYMPVLKVAELAELLAAGRNPQLLNVSFPFETALLLSVSPFLLSSSIISSYNYFEESSFLSNEIQ